MATTYQILDVKKYRQESDRDLWYVLFEHERERGYTWQPSSVLGVIPNELRHKMLVMRRKWIASVRLKHYLKVKLLWLLSGFSLASMACAGTERWREALNDPLAFRAFQLTLPICWWVVLGMAVSAIFVWQALRLAQHQLPQSAPRSSRLARSFREKHRLPMPTRIQPVRACRKRNPALDASAASSLDT